MKSSPNSSNRKWSVKRTVLISSLLILLTAGFLVYYNFNRLLTRALNKSFNASLLSDIYELKFENLLVNPFEGTIRVSNVTLQPREKPLHHYPYINSAFRLKAKKLTLLNVEIFTLLKSNKLHLERISITKPDIEVTLAGKRHILFPFKDSTATPVPSEVKNKKSLDSFVLNEFQLMDASLHTINTENQREFNVRNLNISLYDLFIDQNPGQYQASFSKVALGIGELQGHANKGRRLQKISFQDFQIGIDSLILDITLDTLKYRFHDFNAGLQALDIQTADSTFHMMMKSFNLSYLDKSIKLKAVSLKPNVSHAQLQQDYKYQHTEFSGSVGTLELNQVNFDSLLYAQKLLIDEILLDSVRLFIFKDKTKPSDSTRRPAYLSHTLQKVTLPLHIKHVKATHVQLDNSERKPDSTYARVKITRATLDAKNITNLSQTGSLVIKTDAYINDKAHFKAGLTYRYNKPEIVFEGVVEKFSLPDLNPLIQAYTPAKINDGILDEISFSGVAGERKAEGTMKFLYHDLKIDLKLHNQAKWKSAFVTFAANSILNSSNPVSSNSPPRIVQFRSKRDMTKGFINLFIKSLLNGFKETMIMSKENRKAHREAKKK